MTCTKHGEASETQCRECVKCIDRSEHKDGSDESFKCRDFKKVRGELKCPRMEDWLGRREGRGGNRVNLRFRVFTGNSGYLPALWRKRSAVADGGYKTHLGVDFDMSRMRP